MRNLVLLVLLGLGVSYCIYYFTTDRQEAPSIAQDNAPEYISTRNLNVVGMGIEYDQQEQGQQTLNCISNNTNLAGINLDGNDRPIDLLQANDMGNSSQELNPGTNRRTYLLGPKKLQKLMHQHKAEGCACTLPNNGEADKRKISTPNWLRAFQKMQRN